MSAERLGREAPVWRLLADPLQGRTSLSRVFWLYGCGVSLGYGVLGWALESGSPAVTLTYQLVGVGLGLAQSVMFWQCAFNSRSRFLGILTRAGVIVGVLTLPVVVYVTVKYPGLFELG